MILLDEEKSAWLTFLIWRDGKKKKTQKNLPVQVVPFPSKPFLQVQLKPPSVFLQSASFEQSFQVEFLHSSMSLKKWINK